MKTLNYPTLEKEEIPKMRLVSHRFNLLATECVQKLCRVRFETDSDIAKLVTMFENKAVVPSHKFKFIETVLAYGQPLEQFCTRFGKIVKYWKIFDAGDWEASVDNSVAKNLEILLENCVNVEKIVYDFTTIYTNDEIEKFTKIPVLRNLKTFTISWFDVEDKDFLTLLHQIFEKAPNLRTVWIKRLMNDNSSLLILRNTLNQLYNMNCTVGIQNLVIIFDVPMTNIGDVEELEISKPFRIVELDFAMHVRDRDPERLPQQVQILSKWIQQLACLRTLHLEYKGMPNNEALDQPNVPIVLPLHSMPNLEWLNLTVLNLEVYVPVGPDQQLEFPALKGIYCSLYHPNTNNFLFSGCHFPNVKFAQIYLNTEEECEEWPRILPNVDKLFVSSKTLKGIFRFSKLWKLDISVTTGDNPDDDYRQVCRQHWTYLTGGSEYIGDGTRIQSFRNLPLLTHLRFTGETEECWKGIAYASRTGQLRCLEKLTFSGDFDIKPCRTQLMMYQPSTRIIPGSLTSFGFRQK